MLFHVFTLEGRAAEFYVDAGVLPTPQAEWTGRNGGKPSIANSFWEYRLRSPANSLGLWQLDLDDTAAIAQLLDALRDLTERLAHPIERKNLLAFVRDPTTKASALRLPRERALALLLSDDGPSEELRAALHVLEQRDPDDPIASWIRARGSA